MVENYSLVIPRFSEEPLSVEVAAGDIIFLVGPNGSGKSGLLQHLSTGLKSVAERIVAHRQNWLTASAVGLSTQQGVDISKNIKDFDSDKASRWMDSYSRYRAELAVFSLIVAENARSRKIAEAFDANKLGAAADFPTSPLLDINRLLFLSNIPIELSIGDDEVLYATKRQSTFGIAELSDGERNAIFVAATVLTAPPGKIFFIDEPERHLHRSITSPLFANLFAKRSDSIFVVATHDADLALDYPKSRTLLVRDCFFDGGKPSSWKVDLLQPEDALYDELRRDIIGARGKILFVEGRNASLDKQIYNILFPGASVVAKESCREVEKAVYGIRSAEDNHWLEAFGITDGDGKGEEERKHLRDKGLFALEQYSVESLYYSRTIQAALAARLAALYGDRAQDRLDAALTAGIDALAKSRTHLVKRIAVRRARELAVPQLPTDKRTEFDDYVISVKLKDVFQDEQRRFDDAVNSKKLDVLLARYAVRESGALSAIAEKIGFPGKSEYQAAATQLLVSDPVVLNELKEMFGWLCEALAA